MTVAELDQFPVLLDAKDLARVFGKSVRTIYDWDAAGKLRRFEVRRPLGDQKWSGAKVRAYLLAEDNALVPVRKTA